MSVPFLQVTLVEGRSDELKEELIYELTNTVNKVLNAPHESIRVCLNEVPANHWGIAGKSIQKRREEQAKE